MRAARVAAGLSQAALADATGLSRQAVSAIEVGRHRPSVDAALALARVLGSPVERLFAAPTDDDSVGVTGARSVDGAAVRTARVGGRRVHAPADLAAAGERWALADAIVAGHAVHALPQAEDDGFVIVGCDPALSLAAALLPSHGPGRLMVVNGSTRNALEAFDEGRAHAALVHSREGELAAAPPGTGRLHVARWRVGLATTRRSGSLASLAAGRSIVVQRDDGAGSQQALERALAAEGIDRPAGPLGCGHVDVARRVAAGQARSGVTMEPAALHAGLNFTPLEEHAAELWIAPAFRDHPGARALGNLLTSAAIKARLALIGGYDLTDCGSQPGW